MESRAGTAVLMPRSTGSRPGGAVRVVLCGSMRCHSRMREIARALDDAGVEAITPTIDARRQLALGEKRDASLRHFREISAGSTDAILVVNEPKDGQRDYIGPNTFAEIAVAFVEGKEIFLLHGVPETYSDELLAWGVRALGGDLDQMPRTAPSRM